MYEIIDNFLTQDKFLKVKNGILNPEFSWNLTPCVSNLSENLKTTSSYYFTHLFYSGLYVDSQSHIFVDILNQLEVKALIRIKANLYSSTDNMEYQIEYGTINQPIGIATFSSNISGGSLRLIGYPAFASLTTFRYIFTAIKS